MLFHMRLGAAYERVAYQPLDSSLLLLFCHTRLSGSVGNFEASF
jgi:hypothetical protein